MRLLALDQKTLGGAYALFANGKLKSTGAFKDIRVELPILLRAKTVGVVVAEGVFYSRSVATLRSLAQTLGYVEAVCAYEGCSFFVVWPSQVNKALGLDYRMPRKDRKAAMRKFAYTLTLKELTEDECDAIAIGWTAIKTIPEASGYRRVR